MQKLKDLMSRDVKVISFDMTIRDAAKKARWGLWNAASWSGRSHDRNDL